METLTIALLIIAGISITTAVVVAIATVYILNKIVKSNPFWKK